MSKSYEPGQSPRVQRAEAVDNACDAFEQAWLADRRPRIEDYLDGVDECERDELLEELLVAELRLQIDSGIAPDRGQYLERFPASIDLLDRLFRETSENSPSPIRPSKDSGSSRKQIGGSLTVRCPHCQCPVDVIIEASLDDLTCSACGSQFSLVNEANDTSVARAFKKLGHFELIDRLGLGGCGTVWKARDTELDRTVALKIPRRGHLEPEETDKFLREARAAAQLKHPNIVSVHEVGRDDETVYIVSDFVRGVSLSDWLSGRRPTFREAAKLCAQVADALHHAHEAGVIHRDMKPQNIMMDANNEPHLMDFGLARRDAGETTVTLDGHVLGTPAYMSPEQARGEAHRADRRADIYSMGVILFELLTGELPFRGNARMLIHQLLNDEPPTPRRLNSAIPRDLDTICVNSMAKEPHRRYPTARALADELRRFLNGEPIIARPVGTLERAWRWVRRQPAVAALLLAGSIAALALVGMIVAFSYSSQLRLQEYFHHIAHANNDWQGGNMVRVEELLSKCPPERRDLEWRLLNRLCHTELFTLKGHTAEINSVAYSPDGKWLATASDDNTVRLWDATTGELTSTLAEHTDQVRSVAFGPNGKHLASASYDGTVKIWNLKNRKIVGKLIGHTAGVTSVCFSPDGKYLASTGRDSTVRVWNTTTRLQIHEFRHDHFQVPSATFSPDGTLLYSCGYDRKVRIWDVTAGTSDRPPIDMEVRHVAFSPDGSQFATAGHDKIVRLWDAKTGNQLDEFRGHRNAVHYVAFSPDGTQLASACQSGIVLIWNAADAASEPLTRRGHGGVVHSLAFSPDGSRLATAGAEGLAKVWDVTIPQEGLLLTGHTDKVRGLMFSPDGSQLTTSGQDGTVRVWDVRTGQQTLLLDRHTDGVFAVAFSPDGKWLASAGWDKRVYIWDATTGVAIRTKDYSSELRGIAISPDGRWIVTTNLAGDVLPWDWRANKDAPGFVGHKEVTWAVVFNRDGSQLATASQDRNVIVWDFATGRAIHRLPGHTAHHHNRVVFSADGTRLAAAGGDRTIKVWNLTTKAAEEIQTLDGHSYDATAVIYSPDEKRLASVGWDHRTILWDVATAQVVLALDGPSELFNVAFSPEGTRLATSGDRDVMLWDARPRTPEDATEREALGILKFLFGKPLCKADVIDYLHTSSTIRPQALELAISLVDYYQEEDTAEEYYETSWATVRKSHLNDFQYRFALRQAETACRLAPSQIRFQLALAIAQFRLGHDEMAGAALTSLRERLNESERSSKLTSRNALREAETLIEGHQTASNR